MAAPRQSFRVYPEDADEFEVTADSRDMLVWEKTNKVGRTVVDLNDGAGLLDQYAIAYIAAKRQGLFTGPRQLFDETCQLEATGEPPEPDPTQPAP